MKFKNLKFLAKGKRSLIYTSYYKNKKIAIKKERKDISAKFRIENEAKWLKKLNKHNIGPKLIYSNNKTMAYYFVSGIKIIDYLKNNNKQNILKILKNILNQCRTLDKLKVDKKEMTNPYKHILIGKKPIMIDFERCKQTLKPKNTTQFMQFLISKKIQAILISKKIILNKNKLIPLLKEYKQKQTDKNFNKLINLILL